MDGSILENLDEKGTQLHTGRKLAIENGQGFQRPEPEKAYLTEWAEQEDY